MVERQAEGAELLLVPARTEGRHEPAAAQLVDRRDLPRQDPGRVERRAGDERAERDPLGDAGQPGERRPAVPRATLRTPVPAVEQVVADPDGIEAALLRSVGHRRELVAAHDPLHLGELDPDVHCQNASNAGGSAGMAVIRCQMPRSWSMTSTCSMSSSRPSRLPCAR